jgi:outer membrane protein assembly factor BamE (lipoprotein component of BamABCDE complex)
MTRKTGWILGVALLASLLAGCSIYGTGSYGSDLSAETAARVKRGMNKNQVRTLIGTPTHVMKGDNDSEVWCYRFWMEWDGERFLSHPIPPGTTRPNDGTVYVWFGSNGDVNTVRRDVLPK